MGLNGANEQSLKIVVQSGDFPRLFPAATRAMATESGLRSVLVPMVQAIESHARKNATPSCGTQSAAGGFLPQS